MISVAPLWAGVAAAAVVVVAGRAARQAAVGIGRYDAGRAPSAPTASRRPTHRQGLGRGFRVAWSSGVMSLWSSGADALLAGRRRRRRRRQVEQDLPEAIDLLVLSVRAGLTPHQAVRELAGSAPLSVRIGFSDVVHRTERGHAFSSALSALPEHLGPRAARLADVVAAADRDGLPLEPVLDQLADEAREARRRLGDAAARRLPVRLSFPLVVCTLPSFVLLAIAPAVMAALSSLGDTAW